MVCRSVQESKSSLSSRTTCKLATSLTTEEIYELKNSIESLNRADAIAKRAKEELKMVFTDPETLNVFLNLNNRSMF